MTTLSSPLNYSAPMNCDLIAPYYEFAEHISFGRSLERARFAFLHEAKCARRALVCGGGDGRFLARLLRANPSVQIDFVDLSPKMIALARRRIVKAGETNLNRVRFHAADARKFAPQACSYDLIVTNFFLDCFPDQELTDVIAHLSKCAAPDAKWLISDFRESGSSLGRILTTAVTRSLYAAFRLTTGLRVTRLPAYVSALTRAGYSVQREKKLLGGLLHSSLWRRSERTPGSGNDLSEVNYAQSF
jgi:ubiquinone/menaquinone biosynthesis C-methylase UbiE